MDYVKRTHIMLSHNWYMALGLLKLETNRHNHGLSYLDQNAVDDMSEHTKWLFDANWDEDVTENDGVEG